MSHLVWFRADLRVADNAALHAACADTSAGVIGVFLLAADQWVKHDWATVKVDLILRTLRNLSASLAEKNIPLLVVAAKRFADAPTVLARLAKKHGCSAIFFNREYEVNEVRRDEAVVEALSELGVSIHTFDDQTAIPPGDVLTKDGRPYTVFTPFKKAWVARIIDRGDAEPKPAPRKRREMACAPTPLGDIPASLSQFTGLKRPDLWPSGEEHARARLRRFIAERLEDYNDRRDLPGINGTSTLSPYLTIGAISPRQCVVAALEANNGRYDSGAAGASTWIGELIWREFYKHLLAAFPRFSMHRAFKPETERIRWRDDEEGFLAWCEGRTGVPIVDAAMRQLVQTGWMHNRLRMVTAMFLTKDLFIDWRCGEQFFMQHLVDGDLSQNNGGWQWSASTGNDAAPYFRIFNPVSQSKKYDPDGTFIRKFVPELKSLDSKAVHEPSAMPGALAGGVDYPPKPIVDHAKARERVLKAFGRLSK